jgi:hypothetical protein
VCGQNAELACVLLAVAVAWTTPAPVRAASVLLSLQVAAVGLCVIFDCGGSLTQDLWCPCFHFHEDGLMVVCMLKKTHGQYALQLLVGLYDGQYAC